MLLHHLADTTVPITEQNLKPKPCMPFCLFFFQGSCHLLAALGDVIHASRQRSTYGFGFSALAFELALHGLGSKVEGVVFGVPL